MLSAVFMQITSDLISFSKNKVCVQCDFASLMAKEGAEGVSNFRLTSLDYTNTTLKPQTGLSFISQI